ncbi:unnamed protein product [Hymenolepis diminuta]|uniref:Uncharacterized protein n=1 Tax=Hymenolepis diminuta TaxID=6216 RepID=A0A564YAA2_HYMDI|nr:unnamed protein product [Hymenolepis diminuta]
MDPSTGRLSPLPNVLNARKWPASVTTENKIFVFSDGMVLDSPGVYSSEVYEPASGRVVTSFQMVTSSAHDRRKNIVCCCQHSKLQRIGHWWIRKEPSGYPLHRVADTVGG